MKLPLPLPWEVLLLSVALKAALPPGPARPPLCCQRKPQLLQSNDLHFVLIYLEFSLELCCATGSVIPHVFYVSQKRIPGVVLENQSPIWGNLQSDYPVGQAQLSLQFK